MTNEITVKLDIEGYDVSVDIPRDAIERKLNVAEKCHPTEFGLDGPEVLDLSRLVSVRAQPTDEKWDELADRLTS